MKSMKYWIKVTIAIALMAALTFGIIYLTKRAKQVNLNPFKQELQIENTRNVITEIRKIAELTTASFFEEVVIHEEKPSESLGGKTINTVTGIFKSDKSDATIKDNIVIIAHGTVRAGIDLSKIEESDLQVVNDSTITLRIPKASILDISINPSDLDIYIEDGKWSHLQVTRVEQKAQKKIQDDAIKDGLLDKATQSAQHKLTQFLKGLGFKKIDIIIK